MRTRRAQLFCVHANMSVEPTKPYGLNQGTMLRPCSKTIPIVVAAYCQINVRLGSNWRFLTIPNWLHFLRTEGKPAKQCTAPVCSINQ